MAAKVAEATVAAGRAVLSTASLPKSPIAMLSELCGLARTSAVSRHEQQV